jgi:hypothetical protein
VHPRKVLVLDEYRAMCRGQGGESEWALKVLTRRGVVEIDWVSLEDVVAVGYRGVDVLVEFAGVEGGVTAIVTPYATLVRTE